MTIDAPVLRESRNHRERAARMPLRELVERSVWLLRENEPPDGYYFAFSGGKDSVFVKELLRMARVKFEAWYNNTTIDPPELVWFIKRTHPDVRWNQPKHGNMLYRVATAPKVVPTRRGRWCCSEYKEGGGCGRVKVFGVRAAESAGRAKRWREVAEDLNSDKVICPGVYWQYEHVWEFIRSTGIPYCSLYDEGFTRLGCVDCPLASNAKRERERRRWPRIAAAWRRAVIANWEQWREVPNTKTGAPRFQAQFTAGEDYYRWWATGSSGADLMRECQSGMLWTNEDEP